jgi:RNA polymerase sigma factor (sigma-70 family)
MPEISGPPIDRGQVDRDAAAARSGDAVAFARLYTTLRPKVRNAAFRWIGDEHEAEDTAQDAFLAAFRCLPRLDDVSAFEGWLLRIARNRAVDRRRRMLRVRPHERAHREELDGDAEGGRVLSRSGVCEPPPEALAMFRCAMDEMGPRLREVLCLRYEKGLSCEEISRREGLSLMAVKTRLFRARRVLRDVLTDRPEQARTDTAPGSPRRRRDGPEARKRTCVANAVG